MPPRPSAARLPPVITWVAAVSALCVCGCSRQAESVRASTAAVETLSPASAAPGGDVVAAEQTHPVGPADATHLSGEGRGGLSRETAEAGAAAASRPQVPIRLTGLYRSR